MARTFTLVSIALLGITALAGCASNSAVVDDLPAPSFAGPVIVPQRATAPLLAQAAPPRLPAPTMAGIDRAWIPNVAARPWKWIVIHHSASPSGNAAKFDKEHREKGWDELGYHFVIGNGTDSGNGQVEVGPRWPKQKWGAHAKTPDNRYNDFGIGICLVGNFDIERPTPQQLQSLAKLTAYLMKTYHIPVSNVIGHRDTKPTDCPGRNLNIAQVRRTATQILVDSGAAVDEPELASASELLQAVAP
jgi:hypothetical protein